MTTRKKSTPKTFKAAYQILKTNAENLQNSDEPDIDNLMKTVEQSIDAYKVCQTRIEAVQRALDAAFEEDKDDTVAEKVNETKTVTEKTIEAVETFEEDLSSKAPLEQENVYQDKDEDKD